MTVNRLLKICLATRFFDLRNGGEGRFSMEILKGLQNRGYNLIPISTERESSAGHVIYATWELTYKLPRGCDVYHCLTPLEAIHAPKRRTIVTFHDFIPWLHLNETDTHYLKGKQISIKGALIKNYFHAAVKIASKCAFIACNSEQTRQEAIEYLHVNESKISVIRFGISQNLKPGLKKDKTFRVGTLSYLDQRKRIDLLIKGFLEANVDGELVIGGKGVDYPRLKDLAGNDPRIKFLGFIPEEQQADFYNSLDLFIFPSKIEGYGFPIVEALACGKPVVVLSDAMIPEDVKSHCTVVENLADFLKNPHLNQDIEGNYAFARLHSWDRCVEEYLKLYNQIGN